MSTGATPELKLLLEVLGQMPPWLTAPADGFCVAAALANAIPELDAVAENGESTTIASCEPKLRLKSDHAGWAANYELELDTPAGAETVRIAGTFLRPVEDLASAADSLGRFPSEDWSVRLPALGLELGISPSTDAALPALGRMLEEGQARVLLQEAIVAGGSHPGIAIATARPDIRRYKPGSRCTIFYDLELEPGTEGPRSVVAKTYKGSKGENAYQGMRALWLAGIDDRSPERGSALRGTVSLAEPLAYLPELRVLVQSCVAEDQTLKQLVRDTVSAGTPAAVAHLADELAKTAAGLAALHSSGAIHGQVVTWDHERTDVTELLDRLRPALPEVASAVETLLAPLERASSATPPDPMVASHRSFRPAQVLLHQGRIAFIDFDGLCQAEPALDVAMFRIALRDAGTRALAEGASSGLGDPARVFDVLDELADEFLARYCDLAAVSPERVAVWETLDLLTSVLHCWTKIKPERLTTRINLLAHHLASGR